MHNDNYLNMQCTGCLNTPVNAVLNRPTHHVDARDTFASLQFTSIVIGEPPSTITSKSQFPIATPDTLLSTTFHQLFEPSTPAIVVETSQEPKPHQCLPN